MYRTWNQLLVCVFFYQQVNIINKVELFIFLKGVEHCNTIHAIDVTALGYDRRATFVTNVNTTIKRNLTFQIWTSISFFWKIMDRTQQKKKRKKRNTNEKNWYCQRVIKTLRVPGNPSSKCFCFHSQLVFSEGKITWHAAKQKW